MRSNQKSASNNKKGYKCANCGKFVPFKVWGSRHRNHCPFCLYSLHVDIMIGDRRNKCRGLMQPIGRSVKADGEEMLLHKCLLCGAIRKNRVAGDDKAEVVGMLNVVDA